MDQVATDSTPATQQCFSIRYQTVVVKQKQRKLRCVPSWGEDSTQLVVGHKPTSLMLPLAVNLYSLPSFWEESKRAVDMPPMAL